MRSTGSSARGSSPCRGRRATRAPSVAATTREALTETLVRAAGDVRLRQPFREAQVLATGGFAARLARERGLILRAAPWSDGDGLAYGARARRRRDRRDGASSTGALCPDPCGEDEFVRASQLYARHALVLDDEGRDLGDAAWHESDIVQRFPGGKAWYVVDARALREPVRERTVADLVEAAREAGGDVRPAEQLPFALPASPKLAEPPFLAVRVYAGVTHTIGGLRIDDRARVLDARRLAASGPLRGGRRRGRDLHRRLRQRPRGRALVFGRIAGRDGVSARRAACRRSGGGRPGAATGRSC